MISLYTRWAGTAAFLALLLAATFTSSGTARAALVLQTLQGFGTNPKNPRADLVRANDGNFYGTTEFGGTNGENGTVYRITPNGAFTSLFSFNGNNGSRPSAGLLLASDGNLYGTTAFGGANGDNGTIYRITTSGVLTSLFSFGGTNGRAPLAGLIQASDGNLYGTTSFGGVGADNGTVFRITLNGAFTLLFTLPSNGRSGIGPMGRLFQAPDGNLYGTTSGGGSTGDNGTVFRVTLAGGFTSLLSFSGANGSGPAAGLIRGTDGNLYGTTQFGGVNGDNGTVFRITMSGALTSLYSFRGPDGNYPVASLVLGGDGNFYGTTSGDRTFGGTNTYGTVFRMTPGGALTTLTTFKGTNGATPLASLAAGTDGNFYGTTYEGGPGGGTVFRLAEPPSFSAITVVNGSVRLTWTSFSGGTYRVEYTPSLTLPSWSALTPDVVATTNRTSLTNNAVGAAQRFYRVRLLP